MPTLRAVAVILFVVEGACTADVVGSTSSTTPGPTGANGDDGASGKVVRIDDPTPTHLEAVTGGTSIALRWRPASTSAAIEHYVVRRDGTEIATVVPGSTINLADKEGTRYVDASVVPGVSYEYDVLAVDTTRTVSAPSEKIAVTPPTTTTPVPTITLDTAGAPDVADWLQNVVRPELETWFPKVADALAFPHYAPQTSFTIKVTEESAIAYTSADTITLGAAYFRQHPEDTGAVVHEATHIIQHDDHKIANGPSWLIEGIADFGRNYVYVDHVVPKPSVTRYYTDRFETTAYFLWWLKEHYDPDYPRKLNVAARNGTLDWTNMIVQDKTLDELWAEMMATTARSGPIRGIDDKCLDDPNRSITDGTRIQLWSCNNSIAQRWALRTDVDQTSNVIILGRCLDVANSSTTSGSAIQLWNCNGSMAQRWIARADGTLLNPNSGLCLSTTSGSSSLGTTIELQACTGNASQRWALPK